jgi:hypothetical protein
MNDIKGIYQTPASKQQEMRNLEVSVLLPPTVWSNPSSRSCFVKGRTRGLPLVQPWLWTSMVTALAAEDHALCDGTRSLKRCLRRSASSSIYHSPARSGAMVVKERSAQKATRYSSRVPSRTDPFEQPWVTLRVFRHRLDGRIRRKGPSFSKHLSLAT